MKALNSPANQNLCFINWNKKLTATDSNSLHSLPCTSMLNKFPKHAKNKHMRFGWPPLADIRKASPTKNPFPVSMLNPLANQIEVYEQASLPLNVDRFLMFHCMCSASRESVAPAFLSTCKLLSDVECATFKIEIPELFRNQNYSANKQIVSKWN